MSVGLLSAKYLGWSLSASPADHQSPRDVRPGGRLQPFGASLLPGVGGGKGRVPPGTEISNIVISLAASDPTLVIDRLTQPVTPPLPHIF